MKKSAHQSHFMKTCFWVLFLLFLTFCVKAQSPVINDFAPSVSSSQQKIVITGTGFNAAPSQLNVWFDHVKGKIVSSSPFSIQVVAPPQARFSNIEVINLSNNLSTKSSVKFQPSYGGTSFDVTKISTTYTNTDVTELFDIASSDFDLDGKPDLLASKTTGTNTGVFATDLVIYQNQSTGIGNINFGKFNQSNLPVLNVTAATANVAAGDLNGDGKPDIVAARTGSNLNEVFILRNTNTVVGTLSFAPLQKVFLNAGQSAARISIRDLNQDGKPELIVSNSFDDLNPATDNQIFVFPNQSTSSAIVFGAPTVLTVNGASSTFGMDVQDFDGDGKPDIILFQYQTSNLFIFLNKSSGNLSFAPSKQIAVSGSFNTVTSADLNKDGLLDLIVTATLDNAVQIFVNQSTTGNISFGAPQVIATSAGPWGVDASDIDGDGDLDFVVANRNEAKVNVFRQDAFLTFTRLDIVTAKPCFNLRVGDYDGDGKPDIAVTSFANPNFSVDVIRNANCVSPMITSPFTTVCNGQTIYLHTTPAPGVAFAWFKNGLAYPPSVLDSAAVTYADITPPGSGTFTVKATAEGGTCSITSLGFVLNSNTGSAPTNPTISNNTPCFGSALNLSTPSVASATYQWIGPNSFSSTSQNPTISPVNDNNAGLYSLQVTVGQCSSNVITKQLDVASVPILPVTSSPASTVCSGTTITLNVSGVGFSYQWNLNGSALSGQTASSLSVIQEGNYSAVVTDNTTTCSQETTPITISMYAAPIAAFTFSTANCLGVSITFTNQTTADSRGTLVYSWNFGDTHTSASQSPSNTYANAGSFNPSLMVSYSGVAGCSSSISKSIIVNTPVVPVIAASLNPICSGETTTLSITGSYSSIAWAGTTGTSANLDVSQTGLYKVNTTDTKGCLSSDSITINAKPILTFTVSADTTIKSGDQVTLLASGADSYLWSPGKTLSDSVIANPIAKPSLTTTYNVLGSKTGFCGSRDSVKITVITTGQIINPPVLFSPNGDSFNDLWKIPETDSYPDCTMTIYDGHGSQVYQRKGYNSANYWNGTYNGTPVPDGTYFYVFSCPNSQIATGSVLVAR